MPLWFILSALGGFASNISNSIIRTVLKEGEDAITFGWLFDLTRVIASLIIFPFDNMLIISATSLIVFFLTAFSGAISTVFYVRMHQHSHLSLSTIFSRLRIIWTPLLAYLLIHERLMPDDYVSIIIVFIGIAIVVSPKKLLVDKGIHFALLYSVVGAINVLLTKISLSYISSSGVILLSSVGTLGVFPILMKNGPERLLNGAKSLDAVKIMCFLLNLVASYCFTFAIIFGGSASGVNVVYQSMMVVSVIYGIMILKEKEMIKRKIIGTALTLLGIIGLSN